MQVRLDVIPVGGIDGQRCNAEGRVAAASFGALSEARLAQKPGSWTEGNAE
jgi:hypothetical protein